MSYRPSRRARSSACAARVHLHCIACFVCSRHVRLVLRSDGPVSSRCELASLSMCVSCEYAVVMRMLGVGIAPRLVVEMLVL